MLKAAQAAQRALRDLRRATKPDLCEVNLVMLTDSIEGANKNKLPEKFIKDAEAKLSEATEAQNVLKGSFTAGSEPQPKEIALTKEQLNRKGEAAGGEACQKHAKDAEPSELSRGSTSPSGRSGSPGRENRSPTRASSQRGGHAVEGRASDDAAPQFGASMSLDGLNSSGGLGFSPATPGGGGFMSGSKKKGPNRRPSLSSWGVGP